MHLEKSAKVAGQLARTKLCAVHNTQCKVCIGNTVHCAVYTLHCTVYSVQLCALYSVQVKEGLGQCNKSLVCEAPCPVSSREVPVSHCRRSHNTKVTTVPVSQYSHYSPNVPGHQMRSQSPSTVTKVPVSQYRQGLTVEIVDAGTVPGHHTSQTDYCG